jgi:epsilon-lactone hydrolase
MSPGTAKMKPLRECRIRKVQQWALYIVIGTFACGACVWLIAVIGLNSKDHSEYDSPRPATTGTFANESPQHKAAAKAVTDSFANPPAAKGRDLLHLIRSSLDERGDAIHIRSKVQPVDVSGVRAEWVTAPDVDAACRLLFIHGGGYVMGSSRSHRPIASRLSEVSNAAVLSIDYRLMPEHSRMGGIEDCRIAYKWILENGPDGQTPIDTLIVAGDSSGANLALTTVAWARDSQLRAADAVVALCPQTDLTFGSPSLKRNIETDVMQGKSLGPAVNAPKSMFLWMTYLMHRMKPGSPLMSPLLGDLSDLPPTLLQASELDMFLDDAIRYANKANAHGSLAVVQTWPFVMHVWHAFQVPEADEAFNEIEKFLTSHTAHGSGNNVSRTKR